jgi:hypothetical protein
MPPGCRPGIPMPKSDIKGEIKKANRKKFIVKCARRYAITEIASSLGNWQLQTPYLLIEVPKLYFELKIAQMT